MARQFDIAVIGGGLVGCAAACLFVRDGFTVAVVEREPRHPRNPPRHPRSLLSGGDTRVSAIGDAARRLLKNLQAWPPGEAACAYRAMKVWERGGAGEIAFSAGDLGRDCLGHIVANRDLIDALRENLRGRADWLDGEITAIAAADSMPGARVELAGDALEARLLVGADGANSTVRTLAGIATRRRDFGQDAITATVAVGDHRATAWQVFLDTGPAALLPLADGRCALVWSCARDLAAELMALAEADFCARLQAVFGGEFDSPSRHPRSLLSGGGITDCGPRRRFPLVQHHADSYIAAALPVALIGDAAHAVHPLAGLGANLGLSDAAALAEVAAEARAHGRGIGRRSVLRRYERRRRGSNAAAVALTAGLHDLFTARAPAVQFARAAGLNLADALPPLKAAFAGLAGGAGDLPQSCRI